MQQIQDLRKISIFSILNGQEGPEEKILCVVSQIGDQLQIMPESFKKYLIPVEEDLMVRAKLAKKSPLEFVVQRMLLCSNLKIKVDGDV